VHNTILAFEGLPGSAFEPFIQAVKNYFHTPIMVRITDTQAQALMRRIETISEERYGTPFSMVAPIMAKERTISRAEIHDCVAGILRDAVKLVLEVSMDNVAFVIAYTESTWVARDLVGALDENFKTLGGTIVKKNGQHCEAATYVHRHN